MAAAAGGRAGEKLTLLSVDTDLFDYHIVQRLMACGVRPRLLVLEYNSQVGPGVAWTVPYPLGRQTRWDKTGYFGASLLALAKLVRPFGYILLYADSMGVNAFFAHQTLLGLAEPAALFADEATLRPWVAAVWRAPMYETSQNPLNTTLPPSLIMANAGRLEDRPPWQSPTIVRSCRGTDAVPLPGWFPLGNPPDRHAHPAVCLGRGHFPDPLIRSWVAV